MYMIEKHHILYTFQMIAAVLVALEVSIPPNLYTNQLIVVLTILICIKHDLPKKILDIFDKYTS